MSADVFQRITFASHLFSFPKIPGNLSSRACWVFEGGQCPGRGEGRVIRLESRKSPFQEQLALKRIGS